MAHTVCARCKQQGITFVVINITFGEIASDLTCLARNAGTGGWSQLKLVHSSASKKHGNCPSLLVYPLKH